MHTYKTLTLAERQAIQSDLAWTGDYNGLINGDVSDRMIAAIKAFQKDQGHKQSGVLNPQERGQLAEATGANLFLVIDGEIHIDSTPGQGTTVSLSIPLSA